MIYKKHIGHLFIHTLCYNFFSFHHLIMCRILALSTLVPLIIFHFLRPASSNLRFLHLTNPNSHCLHPVSPRIYLSRGSLPLYLASPSFFLHRATPTGFDNPLHYKISSSLASGEEVQWLVRVCT